MPVYYNHLPTGRPLDDYKEGTRDSLLPFGYGLTYAQFTYGATKLSGATLKDGAIVATVARRFEAWPAMAPERIGWGAGTAMLPGRPNALRVVLGSRATSEIAADGGAGTHVVVEANLDDATGELVGHAIGMLIAAASAAQRQAVTSTAASVGP